VSQVSLHNGVLSLAGVLDYRSANGVLKQARSFIAGLEAGATLVIDCAAVEKSSSVGIALLLSLVRQAREENIQTSLANLPEDMRKIAKVCELTPVLALED